MSKDTVPEGVGFTTFGAMHLIWLFCIIAAIVLLSIVYRKKEKYRKVILYTVGFIIIFLELAKNAFHIWRGEFSYGYLPFHLCGINILLIAFDMIKKTNIVRNFLYYFCIAGASLALIFPNWTQLPCMNFSCIHSFLIHGFLVAYPILLVSSGEVRPDLKTMPKCVALLVGMAIPIYFLNLLWDTNFMFLMEPDKGNPLEIFEKLFGSHLWGFPILLPIVMLIMYLPLAIIYKLQDKKNEN